MWATRGRSQPCGVCCPASVTASALCNSGAAGIRSRQGHTPFSWHLAPRCRRGQDPYRGSLVFDPPSPSGHWPEQFRGKMCELRYQHAESQPWTPMCHTSIHDKAATSARRQCLPLISVGLQRTNSSRGRACRSSRSALWHTRPGSGNGTISPLARLNSLKLCMKAALTV